MSRRTWDEAISGYSREQSCLRPWWFSYPESRVCDFLVAFMSMRVLKELFRLEILSIEPQTTALDQGFVTKASMPEVHGVHAVHHFWKSSFLTSDAEGLVYLWDIKTPHKKLQLQNLNPAQVN
jgi:hypothetical protein